jgi:lipoyl(octanoyl) transferase
MKTPVEWRIEGQRVDYPDAVSFMERRVEGIASGSERELIWLLEHPSIYTAGTSARDEDLLDSRFPVYRTGRGGQFTYHGPGQRVAYVMLDVKRRGSDVRRFVHDLEEWVIQSLAQFGVLAERRQGRIGIWVAHKGKEDKIAAIGIRLRRFVSYHGVAINLDPDIDHFSGIVPCGIREFGVTSLADLGLNVSMASLDAALRKSFEEVFGLATDVLPAAQEATP